MTAVTASSRLETLQTYKLLQSVRQEDVGQVTKLIQQGIPLLINYRDPKNGECALHLAAQSNNEKMTKFLLQMGAFPNVQDFQGRTPVMKAAEYGHDKTVELLCKHKAELKIIDDDGKDVLFYCLSASTNRHKRCLDIVLSHGADVNNTAGTPNPVLVSACEEAGENEAMCLMLLEKGADANATNKISGRTAISAACLAGSSAVVRSLLHNGADPNKPDKRKQTAIHCAAQKGDFETVQALCAYGADCSLADMDENNALHFAADNGFGLICRYLGQRGANPTQKNTDGFIPRLLAKEKSHKEALKEMKKAEKLFKKNSKPGGKSANEPELVAMYDWVFERSEKIKELLMAQLAPEEETQDISKGNYVTLDDFDSILQKIEAPIPEMHRKRLHEVHDKERKGLIEVDEFLSGKKYLAKTYLMSAFTPKGKKKKGKKGGKKGKKGKLKIPVPICTTKDGPRRPDGGPPFAMVEKKILHTDTSRFHRDEPPKHPLQDDSAWYLQPPEKQFMNVTNAAKMGDIETLRRAFESGTDVDVRDKYSKTPLMTACAEGDIGLTRFLLSLGASVDTRDNFKWTPLHHACHSGQLDVVMALLYAGADGNALTWNNATPLMRAIESCKPDVVKFLLDCNVNVLLENKKEKTAVDVARDWAGNEIYNMVKLAYDAAPKPKEKDGGKNKKKKVPPNKPLTLPPQDGTYVPLPFGSFPKATDAGTDSGKKTGSVQIVQFAPDISSDKPPLKKKNSVLTMADELQNGKNDRDDKGTYAMSPRNNQNWEAEPTTEDLLNEKERKRQRFGHEVDFDDFAMPLKQNIDRKINEFQMQTDS